MPDVDFHGSLHTSDGFRVQYVLAIEPKPELTLTQDNRRWGPFIAVVAASLHLRFMSAAAVVDLAREKGSHMLRLKTWHTMGTPYI